MQIHGLPPLTPPSLGETQQPTAGKGFAAYLESYTQQVNAEMKIADRASEELAMGKRDDVAETLLAVQKADLSFQMMVSVRNKLVDAYREVMRMQV